MSKEKKKKRTRPLRDFDPKIFEGLCHVQCTVDEIEKIFRTDQRTVDKWCQRHYKETFSTMYKTFAQGGRASLRRSQFNLSKTNASMCIWLGKQYLGQKDEPSYKNTFDGELARILDTLKALKKENPQLREVA